MKKKVIMRRMLALLLSAVTVFSLCATAFAQELGDMPTTCMKTAGCTMEDGHEGECALKADGAEGAADPIEAECTCTAPCAEDSADENCPVCSKEGAEHCKDAEANTVKACTKTAGCTMEDGHEGECALNADGTEGAANPIEAECTCTVPCAEGSADKNCPACSKDGADLSVLCKGLNTISTCTKTVGCTLPDGNEGECLAQYADDFQITDFEALYDAIDTIEPSVDPIIIEIAGDIVCQGTLEINRDITIRSADGVIFQLTQGPGKLFNVNSGGKLILENITLNGNQKSMTVVNVENGGAFTMRAGTIIENSKTGAVRINAGGTFEMYGGEIRNNDKNGNGYGSGVYNAGIFTMYDGKIHHNNKNFGDNGHGVHNAKTGSFTMEGGEISENHSGFEVGGAGVYNLGTVTLKNGRICSNIGYCWSYGGGGICNLGTLTMSGGIISDNISDMADGGGIYNGPDCIFIMEGGKISKNKTGTGASGGGVANYGTFMLKSGTIEENIVDTYGGGIFNAGNANFTMMGGYITGNTSLSEDPSPQTLNRNKGGGVFNRGTFTLSGGEITNNRSGRGGGVQNGVSLGEPGGAFTMEGGLISGNTAIYYGGGVYADKDGGTFTMNGGTVSQNTADYNGGGIYVDTKSVVYVNKGYITENTALGARGGGYAGGGIYVNQSQQSDKENGTLYLQNVAIFQNIAKENGAGIACCPYSNAQIYLASGGAIFENTGEGGAILPQVSMQEPLEGKDRVHEIFLSRYMLGGGLYHWTDENGKLMEEELSNAKMIAAYNTVKYEDPEAQVALQKATVFITGNYSAESGGGIGCNGNLYIGTGPDPVGLGNLVIYKSVVNGLNADTKYSFTIRLYDGEDKNIIGPFSAIITGANKTETVNWSFNDGTETFMLSDGEHVMLIGIPAGTRYSVTENMADSNCKVSVNSIDDQTAAGEIPKDDTDDVYIVNTYQLTAAEYTPSADKTLNGEVPVSDSFEFTIYNSEYGYNETVSNKDGRIIFPTLIFEKEGTYIYFVKEEQHSKNYDQLSIQYDATVYKLTITVINAGENKLKVENVTISREDDAIVEKMLFSNTYALTPPPDPTPVTSVTVKKVWKLDDGGTAADFVTIALLQNGKQIDAVTLDKANGWQYTWNNLSTHDNWTVAELNIPKGFHASIENKDNLFTVTNDDKSNRPTEPAQPDHNYPKTGDDGDPSLWVILLTIGIAVFSVTSIVSRKRRTAK